MWQQQVHRLGSALRLGGPLRGLQRRGDAQWPALRQTRRSVLTPGPVLVSGPVLTQCRQCSVAARTCLPRGLLSFDGNSTPRQCHPFNSNSRAKPATQSFFLPFCCDTSQAVCSGKEIHSEWILETALCYVVVSWTHYFVAVQGRTEELPSCRMCLE